MAATDMGWAILIFLVVIGPAIGNYACSVIYRLPRGKTPFERHPYCGHCNADLQPKDLFPILSWFSTRGRCRYCKGDVPVIYTMVEFACLTLFAGYFLLAGLNAWYLLAVAYGVMVVILAAIQWQQGWLSASIYSYAFLLAGLLQYESGGDLFSWLITSFVVLVVCLAWQRLATFAMGKPFLPFETPWIWWLVLMAATLFGAHLRLLLPVVVVIGLFRVLPAPWRPWSLVPVAAYALMLPAMQFAGLNLTLL